MSTLYVNNIEPVSGSSLILISASLVSVDSITTPSFTSSFQGDLQGTASFAITASHALNSTPPAGTIGQVQFSSGSEFGADSNLFWDNTNKRLGVGTNAPDRTLTIENITGQVLKLRDLNGNFLDIAVSNRPTIQWKGSTSSIYLSGRGNGLFLGSAPSDAIASLQIRGSGTTSATTSLLVQNSAGNDLLSVRDDGYTSIGRSNQGIFSVNITTSGYANFGAGSSELASAILQANSTTRGFLPPRMTTTQKNAISSPASGLQVYDATVSGSYFHDGSSWRNVIAGDDTNLVWDNVNKRLGIGTNTPLSSIDTTSGIRLSGGGSQTLEFSNASLAQFRAIFGGFSFRSGTGVFISNVDGTPTARLHVRGSGVTSSTTSLLVQNSNTSSSLAVLDNGAVGIGLANPSASLHVRGSGTTSATTALLVQNSAGGTLLRVRDECQFQFGDSPVRPLFGPVIGQSNFSPNGTALQFSIDNISRTTLGFDFLFTYGQRDYTSGICDVHREISSFSPTSGTGVFNQFVINGTINQTGGANGITRCLFINPTLTAAADFRAIEVSNGGAYINTTSVNASAILQADSTTKGVLFPRMTTTQKNAIATPAAGLEVYDATVSGSYFHDGSSWRNVIAGDDTNLVWDNVNKRLGVGFNTPTARLQVRGSGTTSSTTSLLVQNSNASSSLQITDDLNSMFFGNVGIGITPTSTTLTVSGRATITSRLRIGSTGDPNNTLEVWGNSSHQRGNGSIWATFNQVSETVGIRTTTPSASLHIVGQTTSSLSSSLLVQNSAGTTLMSVRDDGFINTGTINTGAGNISTNAVVSALMVLGNGFPRLYYANAANANLSLNAKNITVSTSAYNAGSSDSAVLEVNSTTQGFLPPRMTTTQKNAIATPAAGLMVYDTTLNQMSYYNGTSWVNF